MSGEGKEFNRIKLEVSLVHAQGGVVRKFRFNFGKFFHFVEWSSPSSSTKMHSLFSEPGFHTNGVYK